MRQLIDENVVLSKDLLDFYFNTAMTCGSLSIENEKGSAILNRGILSINDHRKPNMKTDEIYKIITGLIKKYGKFRYLSRGYGEKDKYFELEPDSGTWNVYNK